MDFHEILERTKEWITDAKTDFSIMSVDESEQKIVLHIQDTDIIFYITMDESTETSMIWSDSENVLEHLKTIPNVTDVGTHLLEVLQECNKRLMELNKSGEDGESDEDEDVDEDVGDYYDNDIEDERFDDETNDNEADPGNDSESEENFFAAQGSSSAMHRLFQDLKSLKKDGEQFGIEGNPRDQNMFLWDVKLKDFPPESKLGKDLQKYSEKFTNREPVVYIEMHFPSEYPMKPPFVRIVRPRFKFLTGHVTIGGSICMQMLTDSGWTPTNDIENILVQIRAEIMSDPNAQLDQRNLDQAYTEQEAKDAFRRMKERYKW